MSAPHCLLPSYVLKALSRMVENPGEPACAEPACVCKEDRRHGAVKKQMYIQARQPGLKLGVLCVVGSVPRLQCVLHWRNLFGVVAMWKGGLAGLQASENRFGLGEQC